MNLGPGSSKFASAKDKKHFSRCQCSSRCALQRSRGRNSEQTHSRSHGSGSAEPRPPLCRGATLGPCGRRDTVVPPRTPGGRPPARDPAGTPARQPPGGAARRARPLPPAAGGPRGGRRTGPGPSAPALAGPGSLPAGSRSGGEPCRGRSAPCGGHGGRRLPARPHSAALFVFIQPEGAENRQLPVGRGKQSKSVLPQLSGETKIYISSFCLNPFISTEDQKLYRLL